MRREMMRDFGMPSRSPVRACNGIVSSANPLASLAGIEILRDGSHVNDVLSSWWRGEVAKLIGVPEGARVLLWNGDAPAAGTIHRQPDLAATLRRIAREGAAGFYTGPVAEAIVQHLRASDGFHT